MLIPISLNQQKNQTIIRKTFVNVAEKRNEFTLVAWALEVMIKKRLTAFAKNAVKEPSSELVYVIHVIEKKIIQVNANSVKKEMYLTQACVSHVINSRI